MAKLTPTIIAALAVVILIAFFLPWVSVESEQIVGTFTKILTGEKKDIGQTMSAFQIPILANSEEAKLMVTIIQIFNPGIENADKKSFLIWGIVVLAGIMAALSFKLGANSWVNLGIAIVGILIFLVAVFKISGTDLDKLVMVVKVREGAWLTLYSYLGIGVLSLTRFLTQIRKKA